MHRNKDSIPYAGKDNTYLKYKRKVSPVAFFCAANKTMSMRTHDIKANACDISYDTPSKYQSLQ